MIYSITNTTSDTGISAVDAIMDIYEYALEYNEDSYLYEGATEFFRNLGTRIVNVINRLIFKVRTLIKDVAYKNMLKKIQKAKSNPDKVNISSSKPLDFPSFGNYKENYDKFEKFMENSLKNIINANAVELYKKEMMKNFRFMPVYRVETLNDLENKVKKANDSLMEHIGNLEKLKKKAISDLKNAEDPTLASKYASLVIWSANHTTDQLLRIMMKAIKITNARLAGKNKDSELYSGMSYSIPRFRE